MKCSECGREIPNNASFCVYCGADQRSPQKPKKKICIKCGREIPEEASFCVYCGASQKQSEPAAESVTETKQSVPPVNAGQKGVRGDSKRYTRIRCLQCGSTDLQAVAISETKAESSGGGYSGTKGCLGFLLLGPFGLLCGICGKKSRTTVTSSDKLYWVCSNCGNKFRNTENWRSELEERQNRLSKSWWNLAVYGILAFIFFFAFRSVESYILSYLFVYVFVLLFIVQLIVNLSERSKLKKEFLDLEDMERRMS